MKTRILGASVVLSLITMSCGDGIGGVSTGTGSGPSAQPTPVAIATATPVAQPTTTPAPGLLTCTLPKLPNCDAQCCSAGGTVLFESELLAAEADLTRTQPGLFQSNGNVRDNFQYLAALAKRLTELTGLCAEPLAHDELRIKRDNNVSQHIDVLIADVSPWVGGVYTCRPASF
ncbi:MAG: hypothetical protein ABI565_08080 [Vicinamibacteria bacterium]